MKPLRVGCADHIRRHIPQTAWTSHIGIDPCYKLLPKKQEDLQVAAMGNKKWRSKGSAREGPNWRAPATAKSQNSMALRADWTPVLREADCAFTCVIQQRPRQIPGTQRN